MACLAVVLHIGRINLLSKYPYIDYQGTTYDNYYYNDKHVVIVVADYEDDIEGHLKDDKKGW
jgi:hypothetical protein